MYEKTTSNLCNWYIQILKSRNPSLPWFNANLVNAQTDFQNAANCLSGNKV